MNIICKDNEGFEDQLTVRKVYQVLSWKGGSVKIVNERNEQRWYGMVKFTVAGSSL